MIFQSKVLGKFQSLSDSIKANLEYKEGAIDEVVKHKAFDDGLPVVDDVQLTPKMVEAIVDYAAEYVTADDIAKKSLGADIFLKDKDITVLEARTGFMGKNDCITTTIHRKKTFDGVRKEGEEPKQYVKHLWSKTDVETSYTSGVSLKAVKDAISDEFAGAFSK